MHIDELEDEGTTGADATASGKKVSTDDIFEDGRFTGGLRSNNDLSIMLAILQGRQKRCAQKGGLWLQFVADPGSRCQWY